MEVLHVKGTGWSGTRSDDRGDYEISGLFNLDSVQELADELDMLLAEGLDYVVIDVSRMTASVPQVYMLLGVMLTSSPYVMIFIRGIARIHLEHINSRMPDVAKRFHFVDDTETIEQRIEFARMPINCRHPL